MTIYFLDPDSNYKDVNFVLKHGTVVSSLKTDGTNTIRPLADTQSCSIGALKLANGIVNFRISSAMVAVSSQTELGAVNVNCGSCYWKKFNFAVTQYWQRFDTVVVSAGKDVLKIVNNVNAVTITDSPELNESINRNGFGYRIVGNKLVFNGLLPDVKSITAFDSRGREITSTHPSSQKTFEMPISCSTSIVYLRFLYSNGNIVQRMVPILR